MTDDSAARRRGAKSSSFPLHLDLPPRGSRQLKAELHRQLRAAIVDGRLTPGMQLPASRVLATQLGLARNTVVAVYDMLIGEGYLASRIGGGTFVPDDLGTRKGPVRPVLVGADPRLGCSFRQAAPDIDDTKAAVVHDLRLGHPDKTQFPFDIWRRLSNRVLRAFECAPSAPLEPGGTLLLRKAIAAHISHARAVACEPESIIVTSGAQQAFDLLARILVEPGVSAVAVEDPGYPPLRNIFAAHGARIIPVPVDAEGIVVDSLPSDAKVICVTPSNHMPLGMTMSQARRVALLEFARANGATVVEDDYEGGVHFAGRPLDALQTLDRSGSVFYVGTFTKCMFPALRLGYAVVPEWARAAFLATKQLTDWHSPALSQDTLAAFIAEGHLVRHLRRMRRIYEERRALLLAELAPRLPQCEILSDAPGLHLALRLPDDVGALALADRLAAQGVRIDVLHRFAVRPDTAINGVALGYGLIEDSAVAAAAATIARCYEELRGN